MSLGTRLEGQRPPASGLMPPSQRLGQPGGGRQVQRRGVDGQQPPVAFPDPVDFRLSPAEFARPVRPAGFKRQGREPLQGPGIAGCLLDNLLQGEALRVVVAAFSG